MKLEKEIWQEIEIKPLQFQNMPVTGICPKCGGKLHNEMIPCPDGRLGCATCHWGNVCERCGKIFNKKKLVLEETKNET